MCVLYELGLFLARFVVKRAGESDWKAPSDAEMDRELDKAEAESKDVK
jgi:Sec-independent protein secretion pathway component TatC